jgi:hypothetical protein
MLKARYFFDCFFGYNNAINRHITGNAPAMNYITGLLAAVISLLHLQSENTISKWE